jgi:hypothetical protein
MYPVKTRIINGFTVTRFQYFTASNFHDFTISLSEIVKFTVCIHYVNIFFFSLIMLKIGKKYIIYSSLNVTGIKIIFHH